MSPRLVTSLCVCLSSSACGLVLDSDVPGDLDLERDASTDAFVDVAPDTPPAEERFPVLTFEPGPESCPAPGVFASEVTGCVFYVEGMTSMFVDVPLSEYTEVWGRARGLQQVTPDAFSPYLQTGATLDEVYVDGISITTGSPRRHVYTLAAGLHIGDSGNACPCDGGRGYPPFIGEDWTCETGNNMPEWDFDPDFEMDILWDADSLGGSACTPLGEPGEFHVVLDAPATGPLEVRFMNDSRDDAYVVTELVLWVR